MYFIPVGGRMYRKAVATRRLHRYLFSLCLWLTLLVFWYVGSARIQAFMRQYEQRITDFLNQRSEHINTLQEIKRLEIATEKLRGQFEQRFGGNRPESFFQDRVHRIMKWIQDYHLEMNKVELTSSVQTAWGRKATVAVQAQGRLTQIATFLQALQRDGSLVVKAVGLSYVQDDMYVVDLTCAIKWFA